jgi:hypothetical protein
MAMKGEIAIMQDTIVRCQLESGMNYQLHCT